MFPEFFVQPKWSDARQPLVVFFLAFLDGGFPQFLNKSSL